MLWEVILYILILLIIGYLGKTIGLLTDNRVDILNKIAFYIALPSLIFHSLYSKSLQQIFSLPLMIGFIGTYFLTIILVFFVFSEVENNAEKSVAMTQSFHGNIGYMGLPVIAMALEGVTAEASLLLGFGSMTQIPITIFILIYLNSTAKNPFKEIRKVMLNPVIISLLLGIIFSVAEIQIPTFGDKILSYIGEAALPIAMIGVGATLEISGIKKDLPILGSVTLSKIVLMPLLGYLIFTTFGIIDSLGAKAGILMLGMPTAVSTFIYASEFGGDKELASKNISLTTLSSLGTISILMIAFA